MHRHPQYQDLLGSEGPEYAQDALEDLETLPAYWYNHTDMSYIDPRLRSSSSHEQYTSFQYREPLEIPRSCTSYDLTAHGFSPSSLRMNEDSLLPQLGVFDPEHQDLDHFRRLRHFSPTDPSGFTLSSNTDSSISDYATSPNMARGSQDLPLAYSSQGYYGSPIAMPPTTAPAWSPHTAFVSVLPSMPLPSHHTVQGMRHLQVTPDAESEPEDVLMDDKEGFQSRVTLPEEVEMTEQLMSPPDSGLGQSVDDEEAMKDEEQDSVGVESDDDSEFSPRKKSSHRHSSTTKRHSLRETRRPKVVLDDNARVTKPPHTRNASHGSNSPRAKSKKKPPVTKKAESKESKSFPCAFHHYGCCATFANKNEWKRHVSSQHLQLGFFRCDMDGCADYHKGFNDFNRKDLFTQHCRRMHAPWSATRKGEDGVSKKEKDNFEKQLDIIRARCWIDRRKAPQKTKCGFCTKKFVDGKDSKAWDERMEHTGRHYERDHAKTENEAVDDGLKQWAITEGVVVEGRKQGVYWLPGFEPAPGTRASKGQRRSNRNLKTEDVEEDKEPNGAAAEEDDDDKEEDSIEVKRTTVPVKTETSSEDEDADSETDIDAEAEDDE